MKKNRILPILMLGAMAFTACDSDRDDNPVLDLNNMTSEFVLNTPAYSTQNLDLETSSTVNFTWSQPAYGFTAATTYALQLSKDGTFTDAVYDEEGNELTPATYRDLDGSYTTVSGQTDAADFNEAIVGLYGWAEAEEVPTDPITVYVRCKASLASAAVPTLYSNVVSLNVLPYYVKLIASGPATWYLIGACIGDGGWNKSIDGVGTSMLPMDIDPDCTYDVNGNGTFVYTGYFLAGDEFKVVGTYEDDGWAAQFGNSGGAGIDAIVYGDGSSSNLSISEEGWYRLVVNSAESTPTLSITKVDAPSETAYPQMLITGDFDGWACVEQMKPCTNTANNHSWYYILDATGSDTTCKFLTDDSWAVNWGATGFPYGFGVQNGDNIPVTGGFTYVIVFNDLTGCYQFIAK